MSMTTACLQTINHVDKICFICDEHMGGPLVSHSGEYGMSNRVGKCCLATKNKGRATHFPLKSGGELRFSKKDRPLFLNQINKSSSGPEVNECVMNEKLLTLHVKENLQ
jgi:hypothetical protein